MDLIGKEKTKTKIKLNNDAVEINKKTFINVCSKMLNTFCSSSDVCIAYMCIGMCICVWVCVRKTSLS